jgi:hypothetical protein
MFMLDTYDQLEVYCPQLGMLVTVNYCRRAQSSLPCRNFIGCWEQRLPVMDFLAENYTGEEMENAFGGLPKTRLERIFDCLSRIKENQSTG